MKILKRSTKKRSVRQRRQLRWRRNLRMTIGMLDWKQKKVLRIPMCLRFRWSHDSAFALVSHVNRLFLIFVTTLSVLRCFHSLISYHSCYRRRRCGKFKTLIEILLLYLTTCEVSKNRQIIGDSIWFKALAKATTRLKF